MDIREGKYCEKINYKNNSIGRQFYAVFISYGMWFAAKGK